MTGIYKSKEEAIMTGLFYAGFKDIEERKKLMADLKPKKGTLGWPHDVDLEVYDFKNIKGADVSIGIGEFRDGYDLWLIDPKSGASAQV